jgi:5'(3')-deoxyribonucleotidase
VNNIKKLYVDFDGTLINSIKKIVSLYDLDYSNEANYKKVHWTDINSWGFNELKLTDKDKINGYFCDPRFFDNNLEYMDNAYEVINRLKEYYYIYIVSMGLTVNLSLKNTWLRKNLPFAEFIGCNLNDFSNKSHLDLSDGTLIDDVAENLDFCNAEEKIVFGDIYPWNKESKYIRKYNWTDSEKYLMMKI